MQQELDRYYDTTRYHKVWPGKPSEDVEIIRLLLTEKIAATLRAATRGKVTRSRLTGADVKELAYEQPLKYLPKLTAWVNKVVESGELYEEAECTMTDEQEGGDDDDGGEGGLTDDDSDEDDDDEDRDDDVPLARLAKHQANVWANRKGNKPRQGESLDQYTDRLSGLLQDGMRLRSLAGKRKRDTEVVAQRVHTAATGATVEETPHSILDKKTRVSDRRAEYLCRWHDPGFADQDEVRWVNEVDAIAQWEEKVEDFEANLRIKQKDSDHWEVKAIVGRRVVDDQVEYEVEWSGTDSRGRPWSNWWFPIGKLDDCQELINKFNGRNKKRKKKK